MVMRYYGNGASDWWASSLTTTTTTKGATMKLADIDPRVTEWFEGRSRKVGAWSYSDSISPFMPGCGSYTVRHVYHYGTCMGVFAYSCGSWEFAPISTGWGSVSDQGGMNKMLKGYGWYYRRAGGAEYVRTV